MFPVLLDATMSRFPYPEMVSILLENGADPNCGISVAAFYGYGDGLKSMPDIGTVWTLTLAAIAQRLSPLRSSDQMFFLEELEAHKKSLPEIARLMVAHGAYTDRQVVARAVVINIPNPHTGRVSVEERDKLVGQLVHELNCYRRGKGALNLDYISNILSLFGNL